MGFHRIRRAAIQMTQVIHGIPRNIPWNSVELWYRQMKYNLVPWNSMELWDCRFIQYHVTLDFHGISHGIPWNSGVAKEKITEFHGIPWNYEGAISNYPSDPWNSMRYFMELWCRQMKYHLGILWNFENTMLPWTSMGYSMEFYGTLESPNTKITEFQVIP